MALDPVAQDSILGLIILNQDVLVTDLYDSYVNGVYYSKIFQKPSNHIWYQLNWIDNQTTSTQANRSIDVRTRTGDSLPYSSLITYQRYTLAEMNALIQSENPNEIDGMLYRWQMERSCLSSESGNPTITNQDQFSFFQLGTTMQSARLSGDNDPVWNYWSLPILHNKTYISNNVNHDYIQLRIDLRSLDQISPVNMYKITLSSILKKNADV
jgi:hypothetical protein